MARRDIVVIGGSAGGIGATMCLLEVLPAELRAAIFVVIHVPAYSPSMIPQMLQRHCRLPVSHAVDGEPLRQGRVYVAPPDRHMLIDHHRILVRKGPRENRFRPSVDALFRSAAYLYGSRVTGVVLSGALDDGTSGMWSIKHRGGTTIVQDPSDAEHTGMPESVLEYVKVDHVLPAEAIGPLLVRLVDDAPPAERALSARIGERLDMEVSIARGDNAFEQGVLEAGAPSPFTCPECHGTLVRFDEDRFMRFRCHTGHAYSANALLASVTETVEETLWQSMQRLEEASMLLNHLAEHLDKRGDHPGADVFHAKAHAAAEQARALHAFIETYQQVSEDVRTAARERRVAREERPTLHGERRGGNGQAGAAEESTR
jgi:two-component system chemotaxis response regulator CheB